MTKRMLILTALATSATLPLLAQNTTGDEAHNKGAKNKTGADAGARRGNPEEMFKRLDTNHDNQLSLEELKASPMGQRNPDKVEAHFKRLDKDGNGSVSLEEFKEVQERRLENREKKNAAATPATSGTNTGGQATHP